MISTAGLWGGKGRQVLFADGFEGLGFGCGLKQKGCIVAQDAHHDHHDEDGQKHPVAKSRVQEE